MLAIAAVSCFVSMGAMNVIHHRKQQLRGRIYHEIVENIKRLSLFYPAADEPKSKQYDFLPQEINSKIFDYMTFNSCAESLQETAQIISALVQTNRHLNALINDEDKTLRLIKELSLKFDCANMEIVEVLCTKAANCRFALQKAFLQGHSKISFSLDRVDKLKRSGLDIDFSYNKYRPTALLKIAGDFGWTDVGMWLIENGADINITCPFSGSNACMLALGIYNKKLVDILLDCSTLNINHQDLDGNILLHYCFYVVKGKNRGKIVIKESLLPSLCEIIEKILEKGGNSAIKNNDRKTPLDLAHDLECKPLIDLLILKKPLIEYAKY